MVNRHTRDAQHLACRHVDRLPVDRPRRNAFEAVNRLFEAVVAVRSGHPTARPDRHLEHRHAGTGVAAFDEELHSRVADTDQLTAHPGPLNKPRAPSTWRVPIRSSERAYSAWETSRTPA